MTQRNPILVGAGGMLAAAALLGGGMGVGTLPPQGLAYSPPAIEAPQVDQLGPRQKNRKLRERQNRKARRRAEAAYQAGRKRRKSYAPDTFMVAINALSNWQRHQWVRAGRPGKKERSAAAVYQFREEAISRRVRRYASGREG